MATLSDILQLLPDVGRMRLAYNPTFWVRAANSILSMIEAEARGPDLSMEAYIPFNGRQTIYQIPAAMRKLLRVRLPDENGILDLSSSGSEIPFHLRGDRLVQLAAPMDITPARITVSQAVGSFDAVRGNPSVPISSSVGEGWAAIITHTTTDGSIEYRRVLSHEDNLSDVFLDGPTIKQIAPGDSVLLVDLYMIFEGQKKMPRFVDEESESPLPDEWNRVLETGLRWKLEAQSDEEGASAAAAQWFSQFREAIEAFAGDMSERPGDQNRVAPRGGSHWDIL